MEEPRPDVVGDRGQRQPNELAALALAKLVWGFDHGYKMTWRQLLPTVRTNVGDSTFGVA